MSTFNVHGGHNSIVPGASGILDELTEDRKVKNGVIDKLKAAGHTAYDCTDESGRSQGANLANIVAKCNQHGVDVDVSIHLNSGRGDNSGDGKTGGVEVFIYNEGIKDRAKAVADAIAADLGYSLRSDSTTPEGYAGVKISKSLYVLKHTKSSAMLVECCFVDDRDDANNWNADKCAAAIVRGLTGAVVSSGSTPAPQPAPAPAPAEPSKTLLSVDGKMGEKTTRRAQEVFGTPVDGKISNQLLCYKDICKGILSAEWENAKKGGSDLIGAIQRWLDVNDDGYLGPKTITKWQAKMGTVQDGKISNPSKLIEAFQNWLNEQP